MPSNMAILGTLIGRVFAFRADPESADPAVRAVYAIAQRNEANLARFQAATRDNWSDTMTSPLAVNQKNRALETSTQAEIDGLLEGLAVIRRQASERLRRLLPAPDAQAEEIRAALRARPEDLRRRWAYEQRELAARGDVAARARLAAVLDDPLGELVIEPERGKLLRTLMKLTDPNGFAAIQELETVVDSTERWVSDSRAYVAQVAGITQRERFFEQERELKQRRQMTFGPDSAA